MYISNQFAHTLYTKHLLIWNLFKFYEDISIAKGLLSEDMSRFSYIAENQEENDSKINFRWERNE